jgi:hypothetical protein
MEQRCENPQSIHRGFTSRREKFAWPSAKESHTCRIFMRHGRTGLRLLPLAVPLLLLLTAGCGAMSSPAGASPGGMVINADKATIDTTTTDQLSAKLASGASASVKWTIAGGQNDASLGQGNISANGLYTPPPLLSRDQVQVQVTATSRSDPAATAAYLLTVTPGFVQVLTPETASVAPGGTVQVKGEIAEVNSGSIHWSLATNAGGDTDPGDSYGSISETRCHHSARTYTYCTATYTAPRALPSGSPSVFLVGLAAGNPHSPAALHILLNGAGFNSSGLQNQAAQTGYVQMGSSGGNANDYDSKKEIGKDGGTREYVNDCCGGTLGALVADRNNNLFILSNNHVLAESDQARTGDTVVQPALVDLNCNPQAGRTVGSLRYVVPIQSTQTNVDAALAAATPAVDGTGAILQLGPSINGVLTPAAPAAGVGETLTAGLLNQLRVAKSGRTTGLTCSTVNTVNLTVQVDYYYDCAETQRYYTKTYVNQIGMPGASFADSGDSGALVLDASNAQPLGLFFASGADDSNHGFSVANPIQDVLSELGQKSQAEGQEFQIAGGAPHPITCSNYDEHTPPATRSVSSLKMAAARNAAESANAQLLRPDNSILGTATGKSLDSPGEAAVIVYVDKNKPGVAVPKVINGIRTLVIPTDVASMNAGIAPTTLSQVEGIHLPADVLRAATAVQRQFSPQLMADPAFFGVGVTQSYDNPAEAALLVLVDLTKTPRSMPDLAGGLRLRYMRVNRLHVTRSKFAQVDQAPRCALPSSRQAAVKP